MKLQLHLDNDLKNSDTTKSTVQYSHIYTSILWFVNASIWTLPRRSQTNSWLEIMLNDVVGTATKPSVCYALTSLNKHK